MYYVDGDILQQSVFQAPALRTPENSKGLSIDRDLHEDKEAPDY
jgi:hypothetical protein